VCSSDLVPPFVDLPFDRALETAGEQSKAVFIDFFTTWCGPCKRLDAETWTDESVRTWLSDRAIPLKLDAEEQKELADRYRIRGYPTMLFLTPEGEEIERLVGFLPPADFLEQAGLILESGTTDELIARRRELAHESGAPARLEYVGLLLRHERYEEALAELIWCYDIGMGSGSVFRGSRNTRVIDEFERLADRYKPAHDELDRRAVALLRKASRNRANGQELHDLSAIDRAIGREDRTIALIDLIREKAPDSESLDALYRLNMPDLLEAQRYEELAMRFPPRDALLAHARRWGTIESRIKRMPDDKRETARRDRARGEVRMLARAFEIAMGSGETSLADALKRKIGRAHV